MLHSSTAICYPTHKQERYNRFWREIFDRTVCGVSKLTYGFNIFLTNLKSLQNIRENSIVEHKHSFFVVFPLKYVCT